MPTIPVSLSNVFLKFQSIFKAQVRTDPAISNVIVPSFDTTSISGDLTPYTSTTLDCSASDANLIVVPDKKMYLLHVARRGATFGATSLRLKTPYGGTNYAVITLHTTTEDTKVFSPPLFLPAGSVVYLANSGNGGDVNREASVLYTEVDSF